MPVFGTATDSYQTRSVVFSWSARACSIWWCFLAFLTWCPVCLFQVYWGRGVSWMDGWMTGMRDGTSAHLGTTEIKELWLVGRVWGLTVSAKHQCCHSSLFSGACYFSEHDKICWALLLLWRWCKDVMAGRSSLATWKLGRGESGTCTNWWDHFSFTHIIWIDLKNLHKTWK